MTSATESNNSNLKNGGQLVVEALAAQQVERIFCVPGESYLPVLDALHKHAIATTVCRQEGGAAMMAEAWGKLSGEPGICFVTRGPGATNASAGVHVAAQDSTPMILFVGQIDAAARHREAFQEVDYGQFFGGMVKWVAEIESADRVPEMISRAWHTATSGRPGPVVLILPESALADEADVPPPTRWRQIESHPGAADIDQLIELLGKAENPIAVVGGSRWSARAVDQFTAFAERFELPVAVSFRRQMLFDNLHPNFAGDVGIGINPKLAARVKNADLLLLMGCRFSEMPSQDFKLLGIPSPTQTLVHVYPGAEELGKLYTPALGILASPTAVAQALESKKPAVKPAWSGNAATAHEEFLAWSSLDNSVASGSLMSGIIEHLKETLPVDAVITNGAGNYCSWIHRFWPFQRYGSQVAPTSGSMGYGFPAAIAAKLYDPSRTVVAFAGDGCFQMTGQEFGTAAQDGAAVIVIVVDNGMLGTIRMHQEKHFPGRVSATTLVNPDFAVWASAYGAYSASVNTVEEFKAAFAQAQASKGPSLLHVKVDPDAITPTLSLASM